MDNQEKLYENFQKWLNDCPEDIEITNYLDFTDEFEVTFKLKTLTKNNNKTNANQKPNSTK